MTSLSPFPDRAARRRAFDAIDLYPVVSSEFCDGRSVEEIVSAIARGGAKIIQLREKHRDDKSHFELARRCREITAGHRMLLIIDDRIDIALACGADGVHLGQDDLPLEAARRIAPELIFGNSSHNIDEARAAMAQDADYFNIGPIFPTQTKSVPIPPLGIQAIRRIAPEATIPFTVMGGIKEHNLPELFAAGVRRAAMVTEITRAHDVEAKVRDLRRLWR